MEIRLNKYISQAGAASRREADKLILAGRVRVNKKIVRTLGVKIHEGKDMVEVDGRLIETIRSFVYVLLNKPAGYLVSRKDPQNRPTVMNLVSSAGRGIFPVGRLDLNSQGLLLFTNDGNLAHRLMHPRYEVYKEYRVKVKGHPAAGRMKELEKGIILDGQKTARAEVTLVSKGPGISDVDVIIHEGKKREVRRMMEHIGHPVIELKRIKYAGISLGNLKTGQWRYLRQVEIAKLKRLVGL